MEPGGFQSWATFKQLSKRTPSPLGDGRDRWHRGFRGSAYTPSPIGNGLLLPELGFTVLTSAPPNPLIITVPCAPGESSAWSIVLHTLPVCDTSPALLSPKGSHRPGAVTNQGHFLPCHHHSAQFPGLFQPSSESTAAGGIPLPWGTPALLLECPEPSLPHLKNGHRHSSDTELLTFLFQSATAALHSLQHCPSSRQRGSRGLRWQRVVLKLSIKY